MSSKFTTVRLVIEGDRYEILVNPDADLSYKTGKAVEPSQVIGIDEVFSDANRGLRAPGDRLKKHFGTDDHAKAAETPQALLVLLSQDQGPTNLL